MTATAPPPVPGRLLLYRHVCPTVLRSNATIRRHRSILAAIASDPQLPVWTPVFDGLLVAVTLLTERPSSNAYIQVRTLLEVHRVSPNASDGRGRAPLHFASSNGNVSIVALLIQYGANVEVADVNGNRPLHLAISSNHMAVVNELLKAGARPESGNGSNKTPLDLATSRLTMIKRRSESSLNQEPLSGRASQNGPPRDAHERWEQDMNFAGWTREELIKQIEEILALLRYSVPIKVVEEDRHRGSGDVATRPPLDSTRPPLDLHRTVPNEVDDAREIDELIGRLAGLATSAASQHDSDFDEVVSGVEALMKRLQIAQV